MCSKNCFARVLPMIDNQKKHDDSYKYLIKNIGLLTLSQFGTKILVFLLVPLYTSVLTTAEYGTYDLFNTTVLLLMPVLTLQIADSVLRFCLDKQNSCSEVFSVGLAINLCGLFLIFTFLLINSFCNWMPILNEYWGIFFLMYLSNTGYSLLSNFARGLDDVLAISFSGIILTTINILSNIIFLLVYKLGLIGYFMSTILSFLAGSIYLVFRLKVWKYVCKCNNRTLLKRMIAYSFPLIFTAVSWWINSASDRYAVIAICGFAANGIYSVGYKIPSIINVLQTVFNQAWALSSVKEFDKDDSEGFFLNTYNVYSFLIVTVCSLIIITTKVFARFLFANEFYQAWIYVPFLSIANVFSGLSGYLGGIFSAKLDSKSCSVSTIIGAVINIVLNVLLIFLCGPIGAAIATLVSYIIVWHIRLVRLSKHLKLNISRARDYVVYGILILQALVMLLINDSLIMYMIQILCLVIIIFLYRKQLEQFLTMLLNIYQSRFLKRNKE